MRVLYDHQAFLQRYGGVSRYFTSIIKNFEQDKDIEPILPFYYSDNAYYPFKKNIFNFHFKGKYKIYKYLNEQISKKNIRNFKIDLFHPTYFDPYFIADYKGLFVITIHDMIHDIYPQYFSDKKTAKHRKILAQKASKIIAVSENTKSDILKYTDHITEDKIDVIYHATDLTYTKEMFPIYSKPYLLYVGERHTYKNFIFFLFSIKDLIINHNIDLVCAGGPPFSYNEKLLFNEIKIDSKVKHIPFTSDIQLSNLYHHAIAFCYPSLYEGFGIPILEAFACGCPVVLSNTSCFPEIAKDCAIYFNPKDKDSIYETISYIIKNPSCRSQLILKGYQRVQQFSWEKSSKLTKSTYINAIK